MEPEADEPMTGARRARILGGVSACLLAAAVAGCGAEVVRPTPAGLPGPRQAATAANTCNWYANPGPPRIMLGRGDVWPPGGRVVESFVDLNLASWGCGGQGAPGVYDCGVDFPWFDGSDLAPDLALMGATEMRTARLTNLDSPTAPTVTETLLALGPGASGVLDHLATACGAAPIPDPSGTAYEVAGPSGDIALLLVIDPGGAIAISFPADSGLTDIRKHAVFEQAVGLAGL
jgi:hypothetical protein